MFWSWLKDIHFGLDEKDKSLVLAERDKCFGLGRAGTHKDFGLGRNQVSAKTENVTYRIRTYYGKMVLTGLAESWRADLTRKR